MIKDMTQWLNLAQGPILGRTNGSENGLTLVGVGILCKNADFINKFSTYAQQSLPPMAPLGDFLLSAFSCILEPYS